MKKQNKKNIIIGLTSLFLITLILLGLTYAYYRTRIIGNESSEQSISVTSKNLEIVYTDGTATMNMQGNIEPGFTATKEFSIENTGDESISYSIMLEDLMNEFMRNQDWKYTLIENGTEIASGYLAVGTHQILSGSRTVESTNLTTNSYVLTLTYINSEENQSEDMGMNLSFKVNISDEHYTWEKAPSDSLLYALKNNQPSGTGETIPGKAASLETEARILTVEDDYGTSYVYRGNVQNNYVTYSNMCWRVVRVQGDGTIKLALADWQHPCGTENGYSLNDNDSAFIADENGNARTDIVYKENSENYLTDLLFDNSDVLKNLTTWADKNNLDTSYLTSTAWCNDTSLKRNDYYYDDTTPLIEEGNTATFNFSKRFNNPSLKCNMVGVDTSSANRYTNTIGVLTADELIYAGSLVDGDTFAPGGNPTKTYTHYLMTNSTAYMHWTMTPDKSYNTIQPVSMSYIDPYIIRVDKNGNLTEYVTKNIYEGLSVRPTIVLNSNTLIESDGTGEIDTPYIIK